MFLHEPCGDFQSFTSDASEYNGAVANVSNVDAYINEITSSGMSRGMGFSLESMYPKVFDNLNVQSFTEIPSSTRQQAALEALDLKRDTLIIAAIVAAAALIAKFMHWLYKTAIAAIGEYVISKQQAKSTESSIEAAATVIKPVDPEKFTNKDQSSLYKRHLYAHSCILNIAIAALIKIGLDRKYSKNDIGAAISELKNGASRCGIADKDTDRFIILYSIMCASKRESLSPVLSMIRGLDTSYRGRTLDAVDLYGLTTILEETNRMVLAVNGTLYAIARRNDIRGIADALETAEQRIYALTSGTKLSTTASFLEIQTVLGVNVTDREMNSLPTRYDVELSSDMSGMLDHVQECRHQRISPWLSDSDDIERVSLSKYTNLFNTISTKEGREIALNFNHSLTAKTSGLDALKKIASDMATHCEFIKKQRKTLQQCKVANMSIEFSRPGDDLKVSSTPLDQINRALTLATKINTLVSRIINAYGTVSHAVMEMNRGINIGTSAATAAIKDFDK